MLADAARGAPRLPIYTCTSLELQGDLLAVTPDVVTPVAVFNGNLYYTLLAK